MIDKAEKIHRQPIDLSPLNKIKLYYFKIEKFCLFLPYFTILAHDLGPHFMVYVQGCYAASTVIRFIEVLAESFNISNLFQLLINTGLWLIYSLCRDYPCVAGFTC